MSKIEKAAFYINSIASSDKGTVAFKEGTVNDTVLIMPSSKWVDERVKLVDLEDAEQAMLPLEMAVEQYKADDQIRNNAFEKGFKALTGEDEKNRYYLADCGRCNWWGSSRLLTGGMSIADTGDFSDVYCPVCGESDDIGDKEPDITQQSIKEWSIDFAAWVSKHWALEDDLLQGIYVLRNSGLHKDHKNIHHLFEIYLKETHTEGIIPFIKRTENDSPEAKGVFTKDDFDLNDK